MTKVQKETGHVHFLQRKNMAYYCPYEFVSNKVNTVYIVYKKRNCGGGMEHKYLFSCGMGKNHCGICFLEKIC